MAGEEEGVARLIAQQVVAQCGEPASNSGTPDNSSVPRTVVSVVHDFWAHVLEKHEGPGPAVTPVVGEVEEAEEGEGDERA